MTASLSTTTQPDPVPRPGALTPTPGRRRRHVVVGTGGIAGAHAGAVLAHPDRAQLVHAVDVDADRAAAFAAKHGIPTWGDDLDAALAGPDDHGRPDLAHLCTPPGTHVELATRCLEAGVPVLVEKPPALTLAEVDTLLDASHRTGVPVAVVFQHRFGGAARHARRLLAEGLGGADDGIGRVRVAVCDTLWFRPDAYFDVPWRGRWEVEGGGPTMGHGIHQIDLLLSLLGSWSEVTAMAARQARPTDTEDVSAAVVRFTDGALATVMSSLLSPRETSVVRVDTDHATLEVEHLYGYDDAAWRFTPVRDHPHLAERWQAGLGGGPSGHSAQLGAILDALDAGEEPPVSLADARETMELVAALYASAFTGQVVRRGEIGPGHPFYDRMDGGQVPWSPVKTPAKTPARAGDA